MNTNLVCSCLQQEQQRVVSQGVKGIANLGAGDAVTAGAEAVGADISPKQLKQMLTYPADWGPTEWVSDCGQKDCVHQQSTSSRIWLQYTSHFNLSTAGTHSIPSYA
jgi:hypothetical protein